MSFSEQIKAVFAAGGLLAERLPAYEPRPAQAEMAEAVGRALLDSTLVVEAETGIGKTLAYLVPAVLSGRKIVVSTNTLNLQEQILQREIPFIRQHIDPELKVACVKGRQNYLCLHRFHQHASESDSPQPRLPHLHKDDLHRIGQWLQTTRSGDRAELPWLPDDSALWRAISAAANQCSGSQCPEEEGCFITRLRRQAAAARLLIVNHHLFFSDLALRRLGHGEVLPRYEAVIFDEAHHLENIATGHFGISCSQYQIIDLAHDVEQLARRECSGQDLIGLTGSCAALLLEADRFAALFPKEKGRFPLADFIARQPEWPAGLEGLNGALKRLRERLRDLSRGNDPWETAGRRCEELLDHLRTITGGPESDLVGLAPHLVRWYERRERTVALSASPIEIGGEMQETLYGKVRGCIFTSATLGVDGRFTYFLDRLGLDPETETLSLASPFDFPGRTLLYVPDSEFPAPGHPSFAEAAARRIADLLTLSRGRGLVLFTSVQAMRHVHHFLEGRLEFPVLCQGEAPKNTLLETFHRETDSVLLAVASFWEGINVPGESLSCLIIDKLPFEVPSDPVIMARIEKIKEQGGNPFMDFQTPRAILALRQGLGRLMRAATDKGLLAILDNRIFTKSYGRLVRNSLPPSPLTRELAEVEQFFRVTMETL